MVVPRTEWWGQIEGYRRPVEGPGGQIGGTGPVLADPPQCVSWVLHRTEGVPQHSFGQSMEMAEVSGRSGVLRPGQL